MLSEECALCPAAGGSSAEELFIFFEAVTGEAYSQVPGAERGSRLTGFGKALSNLVGVAELQPSLERRSAAGGRWRYNRNPNRRLDTDMVHRQQLRAEAALPAATPGMSMAQMQALPSLRS